MFVPGYLGGGCASFAWILQDRLYVSVSLALFFELTIVSYKERQEFFVEQPVFGLLYSSGQSSLDSEHSHEMYLIRWDGRSVHVHNFSGVTSFDAGHKHRYMGTTEPAPSGVPHTHYYSTVTSFNDGHTHLVRGRTGPAIPLPNGGHYHYFEGITTVSGRIPHTHMYSGKTTVD